MIDSSADDKSLPPFKLRAAATRGSLPSLNLTPWSLVLWWIPGILLRLSQTRVLSGLFHPVSSQTDATGATYHTYLTPWLVDGCTLYMLAPSITDVNDSDLVFTLFFKQISTTVFKLVVIRPTNLQHISNPVRTLVISFKVNLLSMDKNLARTSNTVYTSQNQTIRGSLFHKFRIIAPPLQTCDQTNQITISSSLSHQTGDQTKITILFESQFLTV